jgi:enoyl-CoA hydratase/carnithine racemase
VSPAEPLVLEAREAGIITWTLNRPEALNAFDRPLLRALLAAVEAARDDRSIRCGVVTGRGDKAFSAGADLKERRGMSLDETRDFLRLIRAAFEAVACLPFPTIAAVNGVALGGGTELLLACDLRVLAEHARVGLTEVSVGIMPGAGGTQRLPRLVGVARAKELIFAARRLDAAEALRIGLANQVVPASQLLTAARALAVEIAAQAPLAVRQSKHAIEAGLDVELAAGLEIEASAYEPLLGTQDRLEGLAAFAEKRPPRYRGE